MQEPLSANFTPPPEVCGQPHEDKKNKMAVSILEFSSPENKKEK